MKLADTFWPLVMVVVAGAGPAAAHHNTMGSEYASEYTQARKDVFIDRYDHDSDGRVSSVEFEQSRRNRFDITDENDDGTVSSDEYAFEWEDRLDAQLAVDRKGQVRQTGVRFNALDRDDDGRMTWDEYAASGERMFGHRDTNEDGVIDDSDPEPERTWRREEPQTAEARERQRERRIAWVSSMLHVPSTHTLAGMMTRYDADGDGRIGRAEFDAKRRANFDLTDDDDDGWVSDDEYLAEYEDRLDGYIAESRTESVQQSRRRFDALDTDESGAMTFREYQNSGHGIFSRWDTGDDGYVDEQDPNPEPRERVADASQNR